MHENRIRQLLSYSLLASGAILLFLGAREVFEPMLAQRAAARQFEALPVKISAAETAPIERGDPVGKLRIPRLGAELFVVEGDDAENLRQGPGHLRGSAMPGDEGNCIIAGHRDTQFRVLKDIRQGDDVLLETRTGQYLYRVKSTRIIDPSDTTPLARGDHAVLHLITCYPFNYVGSAPERFVVQAQLTAAISGPTAHVVK